MKFLIACPLKKTPEVCHYNNTQTSQRLTWCTLKWHLPWLPRTVSQMWQCTTPVFLRDEIGQSHEDYQTYLLHTRWVEDPRQHDRQPWAKQCHFEQSYRHRFHCHLFCSSSTSDCMHNLHVFQNACCIKNVDGAEPVSVSHNPVVYKILISPETIHSMVVWEISDITQRYSWSASVKVT